MMCVLVKSSELASLDWALKSLLRCARSDGGDAKQNGKREEI